MIYGWLIYARMCVYACVRMRVYAPRVITIIISRAAADVKKVLSGTAKERGFVRKTVKPAKKREKRKKTKKIKKILKKGKKTVDKVYISVVL